MKTSCFFLDTITSRKRNSTSAVINRISLRSKSLKQCLLSPPTIIDSVIKTKRLKNSVQEKYLFKNDSHQYQSKNNIK